MGTVDEREVEGRRKHYKKLLLSTQDALEAREYIRRAANLGDPESLAREEKVVLAAFVAAFVVAYGRCFASSRSGRTNLLGFADGFVSTLSAEEAALHKRLRGLRDQEFAHSDADVAAISVADVTGNLLIPTSRVLRIHSLARHDIAAGAALVDKVIAFVSEELVRLQAQLAGSGRF